MAVFITALSGSMTMDNPWTEIADELADAYASINQAWNDMLKLDVPHISDNLEPVMQTVGQFCDLARQKAEED
jgi:xylose isomerase